MRLSTNIYLSSERNEDSKGKQVQALAGRKIKSK